MSSFKMPYSNFHELNLDWMLEEFKKFIEIIDSKIDTFDEFEAAWAQFQADVNSDLQTYLAAMEAYKTFINGQISSFETSINNDFNTFKNTMQSQYTDFINNYLQTLGIVQTTGQSTTEVMSQKAVSDIVDTHEDRLDDLEETVNGEGGISDRLETAENSISDLEDTYSEIVEDISEIESDVLVDQSRINTLENNDASTRARVGSLESRASGTDASIAALTGRVTSAENEINSVKTRTSALESDNTSNKARLDDLESEMPLVKNRVSDLETDNTSNKARITTLENKTAAIENDIEDLADQIDSLETDNTSNKSRITSLESNNLVFDQITDFIYNGENLTTKFASEISAFQNEWEWIKNRIRNGRFDGIHLNDWIPFTTESRPKTYKACVSGINTYKGYGDVAVGNHIDFISRELWHIRKPLNPVNYNNGLIPVETITGDGATAAFVLSKEMNAIASVTQGGEELTGYTYDASSFTLTFAEAPAAGTITVTGAGTECPWLASDLYHWLNSLAGQVMNGGGLNPPVKHVDYTQDGVYYYLPTNLKNVIVEKKMYLPKRYSASSLLSDDNATEWSSIGKLWIPSEFEVYGTSVWSGRGGYATMGNCVQYPIFAHNMNRIKTRSDNKDNWWLLSIYSGSTTQWCRLSYRGYAYYNYTSDSSCSVPICFRIS